MDATKTAAIKYVPNGEGCPPFPAPFGTQFRASFSEGGPIFEGGAGGASSWLYRQENRLVGANGPSGLDAVWLYTNSYARPHGAISGRFDACVVAVAVSVVVTP